MEPAPHVIWNNEAEERAGTPLVVMFHGYGSHEGDLMALSASLPEGASSGAECSHPYQNY